MGHILYETMRFICSNGLDLFIHYPMQFMQEFSAASMIFLQCILQYSRGKFFFFLRSKIVSNRSENSMEKSSIHTRFVQFKLAPARILNIVNLTNIEVDAVITFESQATQGHQTRYELVSRHPPCSRHKLNNQKYFLSRCCGLHFGQMWIFQRVF